MKKSQKQALAIGAGAAALAAAATGVYFMTGKHKGNRKKVAKWVNSMQKDVVRELKRAGKTGQAAYNQAVDTVAKNYVNLQNINATELAAAAAELKGSWNLIKRDLEQATQTIRRVARTGRKTVKRATKKSPRKTSRKSK